MFAMREAIASVRRFVEAPVWQGFVLGPTGPFALITDDASLDTFIRNGTGTSAHPVGTAGMSAKTANYGVVDPDLRVKGISGLRIVDASILVSDYLPSLGVVSDSVGTAVRAKRTSAGGGVCCC